MNKDCLKEKINFLKLILTTAFAFLAGCTSWYINHVGIANRGILYIDAGFILILICTVQVLIYEIHLRIKKLGENDE